MTHENRRLNRYICRIFHPKAAEHTFFSSAHGTLSRIDHMLVQRTSLSKFKIGIISSIFSDHNPMGLEINCKKKKLQKHKHMRANQHATKKPMIY